MVKVICLLCIVGGLVIQSVNVNGVVERERPFKYEEITQNQCVSEESLENKLREIEEMLGYTSQIKILDLQYRKGKLTIDLSKEVIVYGGGNEAEYVVICELLEWGFEETPAEAITLLIEGSIEGFPEGNQIQQCTKEVYEMYYKRR